MGWDGEGTGLGWAPHTSNRPKPSSYQQPSLCLVVCPGAQGCCGSAPHTISPNARQLEIERERTLMRQGLAGADLSGDGLLDMGEVSSPGFPAPPTYCPSWALRGVASPPAGDAFLSGSAWHHY